MSRSHVNYWDSMYHNPLCAAAEIGRGWTSGSGKGGYYVGSIGPSDCFGGTPCSILVGRSTSASGEKHFHQDGLDHCGKRSDPMHAPRIGHGSGKHRPPAPI